MAAPMTRPAAPGLRLADWAERLAALVEARRHAPFAWGRHDCGLFAADAVLACTGQDPAAALRGRYATEAEAEALMGPAGGLYGFVRGMEAARGTALCPPALAQRGDTALVLVGNQLAMGVVLGDVVAAPGIDGLVFVPIGAARRVWVT
jgi:hypothetical protein